MTRRTSDRRPRRLVSACVLGACGGVLAQPAMAQDTRWRVETQATGGYEANPFNGAAISDESDGETRGRGGGGSAYVRGRVKPQLTLLWPQDTLVLSAQVDYQHYLRRYADNDSYTGQARYTHRLNARDSFTLNASARDYRNNAGAFGPGLIDDGGVPTPIDTGEDLGLIGSRVRRYDGDAGANFSLSSITSVVVNGGISRVNYGGSGNLGDGGSGIDSFDRSYTSYRGSASIMRRLSAYTSLGVGGGVTQSNYDSGTRPDSTVYSLYGTGSIQITSTWSLSGQVGVSFVRQRGGSFPLAGGDRSQRGLTGNLQFCKKREFDQLCLSATRGYQPTALLGTTAQSTLSASYTRRVSERGNLSANASYLKSSRNGVVAIGDRVFGNEYLRGTLGYNHALGERLSLSSSAFYRKILGDQLGQRDNYGGEIGLKYVFGDLR